jgi:hypothetical protein
MPSTRKAFSPRQVRRGPRTYTRRSASRSGARRSATPAPARPRRSPYRPPVPPPRRAPPPPTPIRMTLRSGTNYIANIKRHIGKR